jgi:hypothetical protein
VTAVPAEAAAGPYLATSEDWQADAALATAEPLQPRSAHPGGVFLGTSDGVDLPPTKTRAALCPERFPQGIFRKCQTMPAMNVWFSALTGRYSGARRMGRNAPQQPSCEDRATARSVIRPRIEDGSVQPYFLLAIGSRGRA